MRRIILAAACGLVAVSAAPVPASGAYGIGYRVDLPGPRVVPRATWRLWYPLRDRVRLELPRGAIAPLDVTSPAKHRRLLDVVVDPAGATPRRTLILANQACPGVEAGSWRLVAPRSGRCSVVEVALREDGGASLTFTLPQSVLAGQTIGSVDVSTKLGTAPAPRGDAWLRDVTRGVRWHVVPVVATRATVGLVRPGGVVGDPQSAVVAHAPPATAVAVTIEPTLVATTLRRFGFPFGEGRTSPGGSLTLRAPQMARGFADAWIGGATLAPGGTITIVRSRGLTHVRLLPPLVRASSRQSPARPEARIVTVSVRAVWAAGVFRPRTNLASYPACRWTDETSSVLGHIGLPTGWSTRDFVTGDCPRVEVAALGAWWDPSSIVSTPVTRR